MFGGAIVFLGWEQVVFENSKTSQGKIYRGPLRVVPVFLGTFTQPEPTFFFPLPSALLLLTNTSCTSSILHRLMSTYRPPAPSSCLAQICDVVKQASTSHKMPIAAYLRCRLIDFARRALLIISMTSGSLGQYIDQKISNRPSGSGRASPSSRANVSRCDEPHHFLIARVRLVRSLAFNISIGYWRPQADFHLKKIIRLLGLSNNFVFSCSFRMLHFSDSCCGPAVFRGCSMECPPFQHPTHTTQCNLRSRRLLSARHCLDEKLNSGPYYFPLTCFNLRCFGADCQLRKAKPA
jgi:hypothetical protein